MIRLIKLAFLTVSAVYTPMLLAEPLTQNQLHATMGIVTNYILDDDIRFHGKSYKSITSPHTGRVWLDRNMGASKKCRSSDDALCYGDYFQWGRKYDGHESSVESTTVRASNINSAGNEFIRESSDWASTDVSYGNVRATNWLKIDGLSVCPVGYRVPLRSELEAEVGDISNKETAYTNFLKFPAAGNRDYMSANYFSVGTFGGVWSVSSSKNGASYFHFSSTSSWSLNIRRARGLSVRCIKHVGKPLIYHNTTTYGTVTSPYTAKVWLDRNLGAARVCTSFNDTTCYGDYYQWGRNFDGHEDSGSDDNDNLATQIDPVQALVDGKFITNNTVPSDWASVDASGATRTANWSKTDASSVCPVGFRVPTSTELKAETLDNGVIDRDTAFANFLKLPSAGYRHYSAGYVVSQGSWGRVWSSSVNGSFSRYVAFGSSHVYASNGNRADGLTVRCLRD